jgi:general secretion pathway protein L
MTPIAIVFAPETAEAPEGVPWPWIVADGDGPPREGSGLAALAAALEGSGTAPLLVVPGEVVLATRVTVPARSRSQLAAALPYVVEEHLAVDVEDVHLAAGARDGDGRIPVRIVDPAPLEAWLAALRDAGLPPRGALADYDALPVPADDGIEVHVDARRARVRTPDAALTVPRDDLATVLGVLVEADPARERRLRLVAADADAMDLAALDADLAGRAPVRVERADPGDPAEAWVAALAPTGRSSAPELLTGRFAPARRRRGASGRWRLVAGLAAAWFAVQLGLDVARTGWLEARTEALRDEAMAVFRDVFPGRTRSPDPRRELEALLGTGGGEGLAFLDLLGVVAGELREASGAVALRTVNFNAARGDLAVDLNLPDIAAVDRFKAGVEAAGYAVTIDSAVQEASGVRARVRIAGAEVDA